MTIRGKLFAATALLLLTTVIGLGAWHYRVAARGVEQASALYLDTMVDAFLETEVARRHALLVRLQLEQARSFVQRYQEEALQAAARLSARQPGGFLILAGGGEVVGASGALAEAARQALVVRGVKHTAAPEEGLRHIPGGHAGEGIILVRRTFAPWGWTVVFAMADGPFRSALDQIRLGTVAVAGMVLLLGGGVMVLFSHFVLLLPITRLSAAAHRIARGEVVDAIPVAGHDELGRLARDMERMSHAIHSATGALQRANAELQHFSYAAAHNLRTPLRAIHGLGTLLREEHGEALGEEGRALLQRLLESASEMAAMVERVIQMVRISQATLRHEAVDLSALAEGIVATLRQQEPGREVQWRIDPGMRVQGDPGQLEALLRILLENAWKFTAHAAVGRIAFSAGEVAGERVHTVRDNGVGFDMAHAGRLFQPFQRLHPTGEFPGLSVGLALAQRIVTRHGGRLWGEGMVGEGAAFHFTLAHDEGDDP